MTLGLSPQAWKRIHKLALFLITAFAVIITVVPLIWMVINSLQTSNDITLGRVQFTNLRWINFRDMWINVKFATYFKNSIIICGFTTLVAGFFATMAGYAMARYRFKGSDSYSYGTMATQMIPGMMFLLPIYMTFMWIKETIGLPMLNTYWGMIIVYTAFYTPMSIWIMRGFFATIPKEVEEAALIDGCSPFGAFLKVVLPLATPGLIATGVYIFLTAWDELLFAWVLNTNTNAATVPVGIRLYVGQFQNRYDLLMAAATISTLPVLITFF
ncbi:MAG TPA: carbohydrate ABC transporter permease, partial [Symbiobacteriaceae bacterium]|nr:carbohydrate ABC transporter permease [Symbiobacteriaceae bacterium]